MVSMHTSPVAQPGAGDAGGMNVYVLHLARSLAGRGWTVDLATLGRDPAAEAIAVTALGPGLRLLSVAVPGAARAAKADLTGFTAGFGAALNAFYDGAAPELVHAHYWLSGVAARELCAAREIPLVLTLHTTAAVKNLRAGEGENPEPRYREDAERELIRDACTTVVNTPSEAEQMSALYGADPSRLRVIPPGVDPEVFRPPPRAAPADPHAPFTVLCAGRLQPLKGPQILVEALGLLRGHRSPPALRLVLAGTGDPDFLASLHRRVAELGIGDAVEFHGSMPSSELAGLMRRADAVAVPSSSETFGLVALEAQACGTPVLATDVDGLRFAVAPGETGWLVPGRSPELWAEALRRAASSPERWRAMGGAAGERTRNVTWEAVARRHAAVYARCAVKPVTA